MGYINIPLTGYGTWQAPVASVASLPASGNVDGDARVVFGDGNHNVYVWDDGAATWNVAGPTSYWSSGGGGNIYPTNNEPVSIGTSLNFGYSLNVFSSAYLTSDNGDSITLISDGTSTSYITMENPSNSQMIFSTPGNQHVMEATGTNLFKFRGTTGAIGMGYTTAGAFYAAASPNGQNLQNATLTAVSGSVGINNQNPVVSLDATTTSATTNAVVDVFRINFTSTGTPAAGIGTGMRFDTLVRAGVSKIGSRLASIATNTSSGAESFDLVAYTMLNNATAAERLRITSAGDVKAATGSISTETAGKGYKVKEGTNAKMGLTGAFPGTNPNRVTVTTTAVASNSRIFLQVQAYTGVHNPAVKVYSVTAGTSFVIEAYDINFVGTVAWLIFDPA